MVKSLLAIREFVRFLGRKDPLEEGMATHSSILAWRILMDRGAWWAAVRGIAKSQTRLSDYAQHGTETHFRGVHRYCHCFIAVFCGEFQ